MAAPARPAPPTGGSSPSWLAYVVVFSVFAVTGYGLGWLSTDAVFSTSRRGLGADSQQPDFLTRREIKSQPIRTGTTYRGDTIHSVLTSSGDAYQNFQTRIMYATYKLVQKDPGGDRLTGFTRILHRTVPDVLMNEVPTFHAYPIKPQCDGWCDYPVANRPDAIHQFFKAAAANESMIQGAWVFMLECDYVWMKPPQVPGSAYDPSVPGVQFLYDYIIPSHPNCVDQIKKLYPGPVQDVPASGPAPVLLRPHEWQAVVPDYVRLSAQMEGDEEMKKKLGWVREMYAWDAAVAHHKEVRLVTELHINSSTIVQPPFDERLGRACLCHYTWGALYHEGLPSKGGKQIYRWEKRDFTDIKHVLRPPHIPMPPEFKAGWTLEFDAPLTRARHDLVVLMLAQMNRAIDTLPDLTDHWKRFQVELREYERIRDERKVMDAIKAATVSVASGDSPKLST